MSTHLKKCLHDELISKMMDNFQVVLFLVLFCFFSSYQNQFSDYRFVFPVNGADTTIKFNSTILIRRFYMCLQNMYFQKCIAFISPGWFVSDIYPTVRTFSSHQQFACRMCKFSNTTRSIVCRKSSVNDFNKNTRYCVVSIKNNVALSNCAMRLREGNCTICFVDSVFRSTHSIVCSSEGQECAWIPKEKRTTNSPTELSVFPVDQSSTDALISRSTVSFLENSIPNATLPTLLTVSSTISQSNPYTASSTNDSELSVSNTIIIAVVICLVLIIIAVILATLFYKFRNETKPSSVLARVCFCFPQKSQQPPNNMEPCHQDVSPVNAKMIKIENVQNSKHLPNLSEEMPRNRVTQRYSAQTTIRVDNNHARTDLDIEIMPEDKNMLESVINEMAAEVYHEPFKRNTLEVHSEKLDNLGLSAIDNNLGLSAIDNTLGLSAIDNTRSDYSKLHEIQKNVTNIYNTAHEQRVPMNENFEKSKSFDQDTNLKCSSSDNIKYERATTRDTILKSSSDISDTGQQDGLVKVQDQSNVAVEYATVKKHLYNNVMYNKTHVDKSDYLNLDRN
ncbi:uncharacterized protein LOC106066914 [Biomphalaria glabrata]|uniref:Uncharacterized protein LOC106066914 n=1 Tax=Biomphalaria glabrata TaxID=6526 RepID=A0A9U8ECS3_BIOGL|nr:uncharacterized protein LOC106066914 [Biomphalaria glabrata]